MPNNPPKAMKIDFSAKQREFAAYIRDPYHNPAPTDVKEQRVAMYRELFFNNINTFLSSNFPILHKILDGQAWLELAQDFFARHRCKSPYFSEIPEEFLDYLQNERDNPDDLPFMLELAHYEWVEMALSIAKEDPAANRQIADNLLEQRIRLSPLAWLLAYQYPVHKIAPTFLPMQPPAQPTFLIVYRDPQDEVSFLEITPMTYRLLEILQDDEGLLTATCLEQVVAEMQHPNPDAVIAGGLSILKGLAEKTIVSPC